MKNQDRKSILCPNCRKLISKDETHCPYCSTLHPGSWMKNNLWTQSFMGPERVIWWIIYLNIGMYIISLLIYPFTPGSSSGFLSFLAPHYKSLFLLGGTGTYPINEYHRWWTLLSANYLHGGIFHIFLNMMALRQLAVFVTNEYGTYRMVIIYTFSGIIGFFISYLAGVPSTIGASAAICGLIGSILYYAKSRGGSYGRAVYRQVITWVVILFIIGFIGRGFINNWGHGGGILAGLLLGYLLGYRERVQEKLIHKSLAGMCAAATILVLIWAVITGLLLYTGFISLT